MHPGSEVEMRFARAALERLLEAEFLEAPAYRRQLKYATLERHETGCGIKVDRARVAPAAFDEQMPGARLPVDANGHGKLWIMLHGWQGYLDDLELVSARLFPDPSTLKVSVG